MAEDASGAGIGASPFAAAAAGGQDGNRSRWWVAVPQTHAGHMLGDALGCVG